MSEKRDIILKLVILGDPAVGKTSLINQYVDKRFETDYKPTLGVNIIRKDVIIEEFNAKVSLILWDIAGQDKYDLTRKMFFNGCKGAFLVFDITRESTFSNIESKWLEDLKSFGTDGGNFIIIGNKVDLENLRKVSTETGIEIANKTNAVQFIETSAKYGVNVENAFISLVRKILTPYFS